jgi:formylglycine-generating enzyme required for sulfatase activity
MGSPEDEPGRFDSEGPQREVRLTRGFWLGETPVTQELWEAVMGEHRSKFQSPRRPVERVSWDDCQAFLSQAEALVPEIGLRLPTEAEWEYACRAGTESATYAGPIEIMGENNSPVLDAIAWYGGNSGVGYELDQGLDASDWPEKQYDFAQAGTRDVGTRAPNGWGFYDTLGNVWEWCADCWSGGGYESAATEDPTGSPGGSVRVLRGGSWLDQARFVRAAARFRNAPDGRLVDLGFRLARGPE